MVDPEFPVGRQSGRGRQIPTWLRFIKFVCQNERIGNLRGVRCGYPLDPPLVMVCVGYRNGEVGGEISDGVGGYCLHLPI